jgi:predicted ATPase
MLRSLHLSNFKCFKTLDLEMRGLTVLSGVNGGGKSSVIQSLVLLSQTLSTREWGRALLLDGPDLALGSAADVINQDARSTIEIGVETAKEQVRWIFASEDRRSLSVELERLKLNGKWEPLNGSIRWLLPEKESAASTVVAALRRLSWITAERIGPREIAPLRDMQGHKSVGSRGELSAGLLYWRQDEGVRPALCLPESPPTLFQQVRGQMASFFPGCDYRLVPIEGANAVSLQFRTNKRSNFQRPQNVGFGVTQLFPIIVCLLAANEGDVIVIENPEVHLHPKAQQDIGYLVAKVAASGVQVIVETHSDHVLNGVRLAVKDKSIPHSDVALHFFGNSDGTFAPLSPRVDADGRLDSWPDGFFDQYDSALSRLM